MREEKLFFVWPNQDGFTVNRAVRDPYGQVSSVPERLRIFVAGGPFRDLTALQVESVISILDTLGCSLVDRRVKRGLGSGRSTARALFYDGPMYAEGKRPKIILRVT